MSDLDDFMAHTVTVATATDAAGMGAGYQDPVPVACFVDERRRLVRTAEAAQVISEATVWDTNLEHAALFTLGTLVTLPSGRVAQVLAMAAHTAPGLDLPETLEVSLT